MAKKTIWLKPAILAGSLAALGSFAYWLEYSHRPQKEKSELAEKRAFIGGDLKSKAFESLSVSAGKTSFLMKCLDLASNLCHPGDNSKWQITVPYSVKGDDTNINNSLSSITNLQISDTIDLSGEDPAKKQTLLAEYGLDEVSRSKPETLRAEVKIKDGATLSIYFGNQHPIGGNLFAIASSLDGKINENRVLIAPLNAKNFVTHDFMFWRDKKVLSIQTPDIAAVHVFGGKADVTASKKEGQWYLTTKEKGALVEVAGDTENVESLIGGASYLTAKAFAAESKTSPEGRRTLSGTQKVLSMELTPVKKEEKPVTLHLWKKSGKDTHLFATTDHLDPVFEVEPAVQDRMDKTFKELRQTRLITTMERFTVRKFTLSGADFGKEPLELNSKNGLWFFGPESKVEAENQKVQQFLDRISGNRIKDFFEGASIPPGEKDGIVATFFDEKGEKKRMISLWKNGGRLLARELTSKRNEAFLVDASIMDSIPWNKSTFEKAKKP